MQQVIFKAVQSDLVLLLQVQHQLVDLLYVSDEASFVH